MESETPNIERLISLTFMLGRLVREGERREEGMPPCSLLQFEVLRYIKERGSPTMREIARYLFITPPAVTLLINSIVQEGLLIRILDKKDRRTIRVALTETGKRFIAQGIRGKMRNLKDIFSVLEAPERLQLIAILERVVKGKSRAFKPIKNHTQS
jgi:DNA-binding MarR family transcriptional regulator